MAFRTQQLILISILFAAGCLSGCAGEAVSAEAPEQVHLPVVVNVAPTQAAGDWWQPAPGTSWQWQLSGEIDTSFNVDMYDIDLFNTPASLISQLQADGHIVICYFSAGSWEDWRPDADQFPAAVLGDNLEGWPGERWLDIRRLDLLAPLMAARFDLAASKGCDGIEPDNIEAEKTN